MTEVLKWALSSDQQIPYHDKRMLELWFKVLKWYKPHVVDYLGDQSDQACYSRFTKGTHEEFINTIPNKDEGDDYLLPFVFEQERPVEEFYRRTREVLPDSEIFAALGNHDIRIFGYFSSLDPELLEHITPEALWNFDDLGIDYIYYSDRPKHRYGGIFAHHGMAISKHAGESVKADIDNIGVSLVRGHSHRLAQIARSYPLRNDTIYGYEIGHMMDTESTGASYDNIHNWQKGFAIGHIELGVGANTPDGNRAHIQLVSVNDDYTCFVDGKRFSA